MDTKRQQKISRLLQKELSTIFLDYARKFAAGTLISATHVRVSPDLSVASVQISIFPSEKAKEIIEKISTDNRQIRFLLGSKVRYQLRIIPELTFHIDDTLDYLENIDRLLKADPPSPLSEDENLQT
ncbi:MAG: ribosome-binding factor A [Prevotellaceae bacterium]|jgi:ribosome-binding factor A|nr:ribosome-binding factor A [Prevotellaceae bacterium]